MAGFAHVRSFGVLVLVPVFTTACSSSRDLAVDRCAIRPNSRRPGWADVRRSTFINGFYVANAAGVNGFTPLGSTVFFVVDEPSVHDERVSSHEIGHILGLRHATDDAERLMFSGTNGMTLTDPAMELGFPQIINLVTDPQECEPYNPVYLHSWTLAHFGRLIGEFQESVQREEPIPAGAPLDFVPKQTH